jgi:hypothetical protein
VARSPDRPEAEHALPVSIAAAVAGPPALGPVPARRHHACRRRRLGGTDDRRRPRAGDRATGPPGPDTRPHPRRPRRSHPPQPGGRRPAASSATGRAALPHREHVERLAEAAGEYGDAVRLLALHGPALRRAGRPPRPSGRLPPPTADHRRERQRGGRHRPLRHPQDASAADRAVPRRARRAAGAPVRGEGLRRPRHLTGGSGPPVRQLPAALLRPGGYCSGTGGPHPARPPAHRGQPPGGLRCPREGGAADARARFRRHDAGRLLGPVRRRPQRPRGAHGRRPRRCSHGACCGRRVGAGQGPPVCRR